MGSSFHRPAFFYQRAPGHIQRASSLSLAVLLVFCSSLRAHAQNTRSYSSAGQDSAFVNLVTTALGSGQLVSPLLGCGLNASSASGFQECTGACGSCLHNKSADMAALLGDLIVQDTTALADICARQPKPPISFQILLHGTSWINLLNYAAAGSRTPWSSQVDAGMVMLPIPTANLTYTECGKVGSSNGPPVSVLDGTPQNVQGNSVEHAAASYTGISPWVNAQYWENGEMGASVNASGPPFGPVYPRTQLLLVYRADWFSELGLTPPATWEELVQLAAALSSLPGFHTTRYARDSPLDVQQGPGIKYSRPGYNFSSWPEEGSTPSVLERMREGPELSNSHLMNRWPLCLDLGLYCKSGDLLAAITASMLQANGSAQNPYLDPATLRPLVDGPAAAGFARALRIHRALAALATPDVPGLENVTLRSCSVINRAFALGACAMTIEWDALFPWAYGVPAFFSDPPLLGRPGDVRGNVGFAPLPGSTHVVDRATGALTACDAALCPHARGELVTTYTSSPAATTNSSSSSAPAGSEPMVVPSYAKLGPAEQYGVARRSSAASVNRAPFSAQLTGLDAFSCGGPGISSDLVGAIQQFMIASLVPMSGLINVMGNVMRGPYTAANASGYFHHPYFTRAAATNNSTLQSVGRRLMRGLKQAGAAAGVDEVAVPPPLPSFEPYLPSWTFGIIPPPIYNISLHVDDSRRLFEATFRARYQYRANQAPQVVLPKQATAWYRMSVEQGLIHYYTGANATIDSLAAGLVSRAEYVFGLSGPAAVRQMLWQTTGYAPPVPYVPDDSSKDSKAGLIAAIVASISVALVMALVGLAGLYYVQYSQHKTLLGQIRPPKAGP
eukprot:CAMPEP_0202862502 /NCGR_PEP_ID=MMETSP1391-20130828/3523_1 /ASSEMBLY_ACC=CAM_ASM_000867 /TAXON_ID=1034604 /ORGANISM="Chlamydomonas leiostraca, Strain SAG 11-49" /LENGTH=845 /DNA_ID=CAMNT_0049542051 /DNA_START=45 /DNA_END=2578 /DNA_ORIENTATION=+